MQLLESGIEYVSKPIRTNELYAALEKVVKKEEESGPVSEEIVPTASAVKQYAERNDA
jgi:YesN/AraC family two-component response regulator